MPDSPTPDAAAESVAAFLDAKVASGALPSSYVIEGYAGTRLRIMDIRVLLADRDRLTAELWAARDLAFRAAFAPEEGATVEIRWGVEYTPGPGDSTIIAEMVAPDRVVEWKAGESIARSTLANTDPRHEARLVCRTRTFGPWKDAAVPQEATP